MASRSLQDVVQSTDDLVERFRRSDVDRGNVHFDVYEDEHTNWIEEQRAWRESCILMDQSYHLANFYIEGPDALALNADLGVNRFEPVADEELPRAKQHPICSPDGYIIGDPILFQLGQEEVVVTGNRGLAQKWVQYNAETGDYDATVVDIYSPYRKSPPVDFRFEIQGPNARAVMAEVVDGKVPDVGFFGMDEITIDGVDAYVLGHGMASVLGFEVFGPYEYHDELKDRFFDVGKAHGMRELGGKAYKTATATTGWLPLGLPAVYDSPEMEGYRRWLDADAVEANWSLGGSFRGTELADYYIDPVELGYDHFIDLDQEFVGRDAIAAKLDDPQRRKVTFLWDADDVVDIYASLFREGEPYKFMAIPDVFQQWDLGHFDRVEVDGELVGKSMFIAYDANVRAVLSLGVIDREYSDPGTEVTVVWGEEGSPKTAVERHVEKDVGATVAEAPLERGREQV